MPHQVRSPGDLDTFLESHNLRWLGGCSMQPGKETKDFLDLEVPDVSTSVDLLDLEAPSVADNLVVLDNFDNESDDETSDDDIDEDTDEEEEIQACLIEL